MHPRQSLLLEIGGVTNRIRRRLRGAQRTEVGLALTNYVVCNEQWERTSLL